MAVLIRSAVLSEGKGAKDDITLADKSYGEGTVTEKVLQAVTETKGVSLSYHKNPISGAYFEVSNGATRNGSEVGLVECTYLKGVSCKRDFMSENFMKLIFYDEQEFEKLREIEELSHEVTQFTTITGRRRIGKTEMVKRYLFRYAKHMG